MSEVRWIAGKPSWIPLEWRRMIGMPLTLFPKGSLGLPYIGSSVSIISIISISISIISITFRQFETTSEWHWNDTGMKKNDWNASSLVPKRKPWASLYRQLGFHHLHHLHLHLHHLHHFPTVWNDIGMTLEWHWNDIRSEIRCQIRSQIRFRWDIRWVR